MRACARVCGGGGAACFSHDHFLVSFRHITDATLAIVKGETVPLDVLQIKVSPFLRLKILSHHREKTKCSSSAKCSSVLVITNKYAYDATFKNCVKNIHKIYHRNHFCVRFSTVRYTMLVLVYQFRPCLLASSREFLCISSQYSRVTIFSASLD